MMKHLVKILALALALTGVVACDTPRENATEEKIEDRGEAAGQSEDAAEQHGEAVKDGTATDTTGTTGTSTTTTTGTTGTTTTTSTTVTTT